MLFLTRLPIWRSFSVNATARMERALLYVRCLRIHSRAACSSHVRTTKPGFTLKLIKRVPVKRRFSSIELEYWLRLIGAVIDNALKIDDRLTLLSMLRVSFDEKIDNLFVITHRIARPMGWGKVRIDYLKNVFKLLAYFYSFKRTS